MAGKSKPSGKKGQVGLKGRRFGIGMLDIGFCHLSHHTCDGLVTKADI
jgi:hypothetical protein